MHNNITLIGHLGKDPTTFTMQNGAVGAFLSVATHETRGDKKETQWHSVVVYDKLAELCIKYLRSGRQVHVEGVLQYRNKEKSGVKFIEAVIKASRVNFLDNPNSRTTQQDRQPSDAEERSVVASSQPSTVIPLVEGGPTTKSSMYGFGTGFIEHAVEHDVESDG
jgi:single-strand DNA-binding protein